MSGQSKILKAARLNAAYMDMPVGRHYPALVRLYRQIAEESVEWARRYADGVPAATLRGNKLVDRPRASVAAFWWGNVAWAINIGAHMLGAGRYGATPHGRAPSLRDDWYELFVRPHIEFARYLRPEQKDTSSVCPQAWDIDRGLHSMDLILEHDRQWMLLVMKLTARWGLWSHLRHTPALFNCWRLDRRLRPGPRESRWSDVTRHYLFADLAFLRLLFGIFVEDSPWRTDGDLPTSVMKQCWNFLEAAGIKHLRPEYAAWAATMTVELELTGGQGPAE